MRSSLKISLVLMLGLFKIDLAAQDLMPLFGEPTRTWTSNFGGAVAQDCSETEILSHWIAGDTLINNITYHRVRSHVYWYESYIMGGPGECEDSNDYPSWTAFVREDSNKVFSWYGGIDHLIYDFNAAVGDRFGRCRRLLQKKMDS
jgi:hypothetical protein